MCRLCNQWIGRGPAKAKQAEHGSSVSQVTYYVSAILQIITDVLLAQRVCLLSQISAYPRLVTLHLRLWQGRREFRWV